jgi:hypothetical protein
VALREHVTQRRNDELRSNSVIQRVHVQMAPLHCVSPLWWDGKRPPSERTSRCVSPPINILQRNDDTGYRPHWYDTEIRNKPGPGFKAWIVFASWNTGILVSNPTQSMDVCVRLFCVCVVMCVGSGLVTGWSPVQGVLPNVYRIKKVKKASKVQQKDCRAIDR